ncbi:MAG: hypothetical protein NXI31_05270 [bacterium]|nr:hypothetical protein [bacterium]
MTRRTAVLPALVTALAMAPGIAQTPAGEAPAGKGDTAAADQDPAAAAQARAKKVTAAIRKWLDSEHNDEELLDATVEVLLDHDAGLGPVGKRLAKLAADDLSPHAKGTRQLATHTALGFLQRESSRGIVFAGQYSPLAPMMPFVGDLYLDWLLDTPDWYPSTHRVVLVPALRDLIPTAPEPTVVEAVVKIVENEAIEPQNLRRALSCMLYQWGQKRFIQPELDRLMRASVEGDAGARVQTMLQIADLHYELRNYKSAAATHRTLQRVADGKVQLKPVDWYFAACNHALCGQIEHGMAALKRAVELQSSPDVDSSHKVERVVWETDPDIKVLRQQPGFAALLERALKHSPEKPRGRR